MDGVTDAGLRMQQIAAQLAALRTGRPPATSAPDSASSTPSPAATAMTGTGTGTGTGAASATGPASFGSVLADALSGRTSAAAAASGAAPAAGPSASVTPATGPALASLAPITGALSATGVPTDLSHYSNGRIPAALLKSLGSGDHRLWAPAADHFKAMAAAAARDGVHLGVSDSYRSYAEQVDMARRKGLYSQGGLAAKPGTSDHGWGKSVDLSLNSHALGWMRTHARQYGFTANVPRESWHWTYKPR
jgi:hypothetical protein